MKYIILTLHAIIHIDYLTLYTFQPTHNSAMSNQAAASTFSSPHLHQLSIPTPKSAPPTFPSLQLQYGNIDIDSLISDLIITSSDEDDSLPGNVVPADIIQQRIQASRKKRKRRLQSSTSNKGNRYLCDGTPLKRKIRKRHNNNDVAVDGTPIKANPKETYWYKNYMLFPNTGCKKIAKVFTD